jgi:lipopolysaccharide/colanic/teichoic acid biosynthesis glycosyltransferase
MASSSSGPEDAFRSASMPEFAMNSGGFAGPSSTAAAAPQVPRERRQRTRWTSMGDRNIRRLNVMVAAVAIVLSIPVMILIGLAVKLTSRGPILYKQQRVGHDRRRYNGPGMENGRRAADKGGKIFTMYKFRTMYTRSVDQQVWARPDDPRITPVGRILRKYRLDELPQLVNVIRGEMNIVGPRPEQPEIFQELRSHVEGYAARQSVLPGITGWAQVNHHYDQCLDDVRRKVGLDLEYIRKRSPAEDLRIMARTLPVMVRRKGSV